MFVNGNDLAEITERLVFLIVGKEKRIKCSIKNNNRASCSPEQAGS